MSAHEERTEEQTTEEQVKDSTSTGDVIYAIAGFGIALGVVYGFAMRISKAIEGN